MLIRFALLSLLLLNLASAAAAQTWGDLEVDVVLKGSHTPAKIVPDAGFCAPLKLVQEQLTVDPKTGAIANLVIFLQSSGQRIEVHPDYAKTAKNPVKIDNKNCRFEPHVVAVRTGQLLVIGNPDPVGHNTKADFFENPGFNDLIPAGGQIEKIFGKPEGGAVRLECNLHRWMNAFLFVRDDPYFGVSDAKGRIAIKNLPVGERTFVVWNNANLSKVTINGKTETLARGGKWKVSITPGVNKYKLEVDVKDLKLN